MQHEYIFAQRIAYVYKKMADESFNAAKATDELTKTLEYQRAELGLITKQYKTNVKCMVSG